MLVITPKLTDCQTYKGHVASSDMHHSHQGQHGHHSAQKHKGEGNQNPQKVHTFEQGQSVQGSFDFSQSQLHGLGPTF